MALWIILIIAAAAVAYVRLAPSDVDRWHRPSAMSGITEKRFKTGIVWRDAVGADGTERLAALDAVISRTPRTSTLAGSVAQGRITYVTRSRVIGFPDYTTIGLYEDESNTSYLEIYARLRFGRSDLGVNARRVQGWLTALKG